jgi:hypothetical protein
MMQAANLRQPDHAAPARRLDGAGMRAVLLEPKMSAGAVIVTDVGREAKDFDYVAKSPGIPRASPQGMIDRKTTQSSPSSRKARNVLPNQTLRDESDLASVSWERQIINRAASGG